MLHVASQGDQAASLFLFKLLGLSLNSVDNRGSTPLHWACYSLSEVSLTYLLAWNMDVNVQDKDGYTALHLAVQGADALDSSRAVKQLLFKGADPRLADNHGKVPLYYLKVHLLRASLAKELKSLLEQQSRSLKSLIKGAPPVQKVTRSRATLLLYHALIWLMVALKVLVIYCRIGWGLLWSSVALDACSYLLHIALTFKDPGYIDNEGIEFLKLLEIFNPNSLCPECAIIRTGRSRHCIICRKCVDRYDHHCPWINNCVGLKNHNSFLAYLILQQCSIVMTFAVTLVSSVRFWKHSAAITIASLDVFPLNDKYLVGAASALLAVACLAFSLPICKLI